MRASPRGRTARPPCAWLWATLFAVGGIALGVRGAPAQSVSELRFAVGELQLSVGDLQFTVGELQFSIGDLQLEVGDFEPGEIGPLAFPVEDLDATEISEREVRFRLSADVLFDFESANLRPEAAGMLAGLAERIQTEFPGTVVRVEGHTDAKGPTDYNQALSERRAESVAEWLVEYGAISQARIVTLGVGESQPAVPNQRPDGSDDPLARQQNRRVEVVVERR